MNKSVGWRWADFWAAVAVAGIGGGAFAFRWFYIAQRWTVGFCSAPGAGGFCVPRHWVLEGQIHGVFGWAALVLGLAAFWLGRRGLAALAVGVGIAAVVNYDATLGIIGTALGIAAWGSICSGRPGWGR